MIKSHPAEQSPLGKVNQYIDQYTPALLYPIPRAIKWSELGISSESLPYQGVDIWNSYEFSWLTPSGKPQVRLVEFIIPSDSPYIIESKSFKLYLNSYNQTVFVSEDEVKQHLYQDLSQAAGKPIQVNLFSLSCLAQYQVQPLIGICVDDMDVDILKYDHPDQHLLKCKNTPTIETVYSHLLKSNCPVTGQPDWGTLIIEYESSYQLDHGSLLQYIISFRCHADFHEQCVERIFIDLCNQLKPSQLKVIARYVRRGGLDINPCRSLTPVDFCNVRLIRQ